MNRYALTPKRPARRALSALITLSALSALIALITLSALSAHATPNPRRALRQLTLDLWGEPPTEEALRAATPEVMSREGIYALLDDPRASYWVTRFHEDTLWPALELGDIINPAISLLFPASFYEAGGDGARLFALLPALYRRGGLFVPCLDEPAQWDDEGRLVFETLPDGTRREGYVWVRPYWSDREVKVCAVEAQALEQTAAGARCDTAEGLASGYCGCGAALERCASFESAPVFVASFREQVRELALAHAAEGARYDELFTRADEPVNGPIAHYYRHLAAAAIDPVVARAPVASADLPPLDFNDRARWVWAPRSGPRESGVLTSLPFLLRFQTGRARANRVSGALLCEPFIATSGVLPSPEDECSQEPNLRARCGCADCHARLEPLAAHWGRFADAGSLSLTEEAFPAFRADCAACASGGACSDLCKRFYVWEAPTPAHAPYLGLLNAYAWRDEAEVAAVEAGPRALIERGIQDGRLSRCLSRRLFERLVGRAPDGTELPRLRAYAEELSASWSLRDLAARVLLDPAYTTPSAALWTSPPAPAAAPEEAHP